MSKTTNDFKYTFRLNFFLKSRFQTTVIGKLQLSLDHRFYNGTCMRGMRSIADDGGTGEKGTLFVFHAGGCLRLYIDIYIYICVR